MSLKAIKHLQSHARSGLARAVFHIFRTMKQSLSRNELNQMVFFCARQSAPGQTKTPGFPPAFQQKIETVDESLKP